VRKVIPPVISYPVARPDQPPATSRTPATRNPGLPPGYVSRGTIVSTLTLLTLLGGILRVIFLDRPGIWGDEAATYGRVSGTYSELLTALENDGFAPLLYQLYWAVAQFVALDPVFLRLIPAICGTAMIPAMYYLARQLFTARTTLVVATLTAFSAYLLGYSRDAKMYMPLWLMVALSTAFLLRYLRSDQQGDKPRQFIWLWMLTSVAMVGLSSLGLVVTFLHTLTVLLHPRIGVKPIAWLVLGVPLILAGPIFHHTHFSKWDDRIAERGWNASGIDWVNTYNRNRDGPRLLRYTFGQYLVGWEWPDRPGELKPTTEGTRGFLQTFANRALALARPADSPPPARPLPSIFDEISAVHVLGAFCAAAAILTATALLPWRWKRGHHLPATAPPVPWHRTLLLCGVWVLLPLYGFYCFSVKSPAPPWELHTHLIHLSVSPFVANADSLGIWGYLPPVLLLAAAAACVMAAAVLLSGATAWQFLRATATVAIVSIILLALLSGIWGAWKIHSTTTFTVDWTTGTSGQTVVFPQISATPRTKYIPQSLWMPRYLGIVYPAFLLTLAVIITRLPTRPVRYSALGLVVAANLANYAAKLTIDPEPPVGRAIADVYTAARSNGTTLTFVQPARMPGFGPGEGWLLGPSARYYASLQLDPPLSPPEFRDWRASSRLTPINLNVSPTVIAQQAEKKNAVQVIVWQRDDDGFIEGRDAVLAALGKHWQVLTQRTHYSYDHWTWRKLPEFRRTVYLKIGAPTTQPQ
jgi:hypothetical protein